MQNQCKIIEEKFIEKFGLLPCITFKENYFCIWKSVNICVNESTNFYKMGSTLESALRYIDMLLCVPSGIMTFSKNEDKVLYLSSVETLKLFGNNQETSEN